MTTSGRRCGWKLCSASLSAIAFAITAFGDCARAQIAPDTTLGSQNSTVTSIGSVDQINGGATRGANLFHSFLEFNVDSGRSAVFTNPSGIENILSRVTGANPSNILGTLGVSGGNANLFLINPHGIIFGPSSRLDVRGSFVATSANAIGFSDQGFFSASAPDVPSELLTVNPSAFFFNQIPAGEIKNQSVPGLIAPRGQNLLLLGGDVRMNGGKLTAVGGRVELGGLAGAGTVELNVDGGNILSLSYPEGVQRASVLLTNGSEINVAAEVGGSIALNAHNVDILGGSSLRAGIRRLSQAVGAQAGDITLNATGAITIANSSIYNIAFGAGNGGNLSIDTSQLIVRDGIVATATFSEGDSGDLTVNASNSVELASTLAGGGTVPIVIPPVSSINVPIGLFAVSLSIQNFIGSTNLAAASIPRSGGDTGNLTITTGRLIAQGGATVSASTTTQGRGGNLTVNASNSIKLTGTSASGAASGSWTLANVIPSGLRNEGTALGPSGELTINTGRLIIQDGALVTGGNAAEQPGGNLTVNASESVELSGISSANGMPSVLATGTRRAGDSRDLTINTGRLIVRDGAVVSAGTSGSGQGGNLTVRASDSVELIGTAAVPVSQDVYNALLGDSGVSVFQVVAGRPFPSGLITGTAGAGTAGDLTIDTERLVIRDGAQASVSTVGARDGGRLTVRASSVEVTGTSADGQFPNPLIGPSLLTTSSLGSGEAGDIQVQATRSIQLNNGGAITATTALGNGGNITLQAQDLLLMRRQSNISTTAGTEQAGGNGGNITIDTDNLVAVENSDITANAFTGQGGNIQINTQGLFLSTDSDITASSARGIDGVVEINTPDIDPSSGLVNLPAELVDVAGLIAQGCPAGVGPAASKFVVTGRGGLPPTPRETLSSDTVLEDWGTLTLAGTQPQSTERMLRALRRPENRSGGAAVATTPTRPTPAPIVEAQGWVIGANGEVVLTASAPTVTPHSPWLPLAACYGN